MLEIIGQYGKYAVSAVPLFLLSPGLLPSSWVRRHPWQAANLAVALSWASLGSALVSVVVLLVGGPVIVTLLQIGPLSFDLHFDSLSALLLLIVAGLSFVILRYSRNYMEGDPGQGRFTRWLCLTAGSALALVICGNLLLFLGAWICISLCLHQLLIFYPDRPAALLAARKKFIISRLGDGCLFVAILLIYREYGTLNFHQIMAAATADNDVAGAGAAWISPLLVLCALLKSAQFPFHSWLPDTMETPTPVSALMHAGIINAGGFLIIRFSPLVIQSPEALWLLTLVGGFTALFASLTMLTHASVKRALAFSTVAQMGFMLLECGLGAFSLAALHLAAHSLYKAHAFLSSGSIIQIARSTWVPDSYPRAHPSTLLVTVTVAAGLTFGSAFFWKVDLLKNPGSFFLGLIFCFSLAYMLWNLWSHATGLASILSGICLGLLVSNLGFALHFVFAALLDPVLPEVRSGWDAAALFLAVVPFLLFSAVLIFQTQLPAWSSHSLCLALYVHARNGFYFTTLANLAVGSLWPFPSRNLKAQSQDGPL